jgi:ABC-2 type transport system permease protein
LGFLLLVPAVTMRLFSEEKRVGTLELLLTKPISEFRIIIAKYLAAELIVILALLPTLVYFLVFSFF